MVCVAEDDGVADDVFFGMGLYGVSASTSLAIV